MFNELLTLFPQFVCPYGYTNVRNTLRANTFHQWYMLQVTAGIWGALMIVCGLIGAALTSVFLGWTRLYKEVGVFALGMCVLCSIWFLEVSGSISTTQVRYYRSLAYRSPGLKDNLST